MSLLGWIVVGLIAGALARLIVRDGNRAGCGCLYTLFIGVIGALIGGALARAAGVDGDDDYGPSLLTALAGAILLLLVLRAIEGRRAR